MAVRLRAKYRIRGRDIRVRWVEYKNNRLVAEADWPGRELRLDTRLKQARYKQKLPVMLVHELAHLLWWPHHKDEDHPTWEIRHNDFARYWCQLDQLLRTGTDGT